jgi:hypothetical protein
LSQRMVNGFDEVKVIIEGEAAVDELDFFKDAFVFLIFGEVVFEETELGVLGDCKDCAVLEYHFSGFGVLFVVVEEVGEFGVGGFEVDDIAEVKGKITDFRLFRDVCWTS